MDMCDINGPRLKKYFINEDSDKHGMRVEYNQICAVSTIFDPRFSKDVFSGERTYNQAIKWAKDELIKLEVYSQKSQQDNNPIEEVEEPTPVKKRKTSKIWDRVLVNTNTAPKKTPMKKRLENVMAEFDRFLNKGAFLDLLEDPLLYWATTGKEEFPFLWRAAMKNLIPPATSTPSERVFSNAGDLIQPLTCNLNPKLVNMRICLRTNL